MLCVMMELGLYWKKNLNERIAMLSRIIKKSWNPPKYWRNQKLVSNVANS